MGPLTSKWWWTSLVAGCLMLGACNSRGGSTAEDAGAVSETLPAASLQVATEKLARVDITSPGHETVTMTMANGSWRIVAPLPYPANEPAVESIVAVLAEIEIRRKVAERADRKHRLATGSGIVVQAWTKKGARQAFAIGASVGEETYVQRAGEETVYAVRGRCRRFFNLSFQQLRDPAITKLAPTTIEHVAYLNQFGEIKIVADPGDADRFALASPRIQNFDRERATKNVAVLSALFAKGFVDAPVDKNATGLFSADTARILVSIRGADESLIVYVGTRSKNGQLHLRTSESDQVYLVSAHLASSLLPQRKHFERSDKEMQELRDQGQAREVRAKVETLSEAAEHNHGSAPPTQVPPELMSELRDLARAEAK